MFSFDDPEGQARWRHVEEFKKFDRREITKMDDTALAKWQSDFFTDEPQWRIAEHEWQRRVTIEQLKAARWQAYFGIAGVVIGVILTRLLELLK
jgi:hypothetical protein